MQQYDCVFKVYVLTGRSFVGICGGKRRLDHWRVLVCVPWVLASRARANGQRNDSTYARGVHCRVDCHLALRWCGCLHRPPNDLCHHASGTLCILLLRRRQCLCWYASIRCRFDSPISRPTHMRVCRRRVSWGSSDHYEFCWRICCEQVEEVCPWREI